MVPDLIAIVKVAALQPNRPLGVKNNFHVQYSAKLVNKRQVGLSFSVLKQRQHLCLFN